MEKVALRIGCAKQLKNLKRYLIIIDHVNHFFIFRVSSSSSSSRSNSRSPVRLISRSNSSSSSSDNEKESKASTENDKKTSAPQSGFKNPLFMLNQKNKEGKSDEDVKQVLVEKLFSLLSNEENNKEKQENVEKTAAAEPMDVDNVEKVEKEKPLPLLYANNKVIYIAKKNLKSY